MFEIVAYLGGQGVDKAEPMNIGGTVERDGLAFTMVNALHSSAIVEDGKPVTMGDPAGFVIKGEGKSVYHAGDTEIFSDMALIQRIHQPKIGLIPIGDRFPWASRPRRWRATSFSISTSSFDPLGHVDLLSGNPETSVAGRRGRVESRARTLALSGSNQMKPFVWCLANHLPYDSSGPAISHMRTICLIQTTSEPPSSGRRLRDAGPAAPHIRRGAGEQPQPPGSPVATATMLPAPAMTLPSQNSQAAVRSRRWRRARRAPG
jgi:hypothetical protein